MATASKKPFFNKRLEPRYSGGSELVFFVFQSSLNEARLENWSRSGLCIATKRYFSRGEIITLSLPASKYRDTKRKAKIVWNNAERCGVQFCD